MAEFGEDSRPNIRVQIANNSNEENEEKMELENEEGEIIDDNMEELISENMQPPSVYQYEPRGAFTTGINIFDKKEQDKLQERARRFALKPNEIHSFTEEDFISLRDSLGINSTNENEVKFNIIHVYGLGEMAPGDVVDYFASFAPESIELINEDSCNVLWLDNVSAARALHFKSKVVIGMPAREPKDIFPKEFLDNVDEPEPEDGQSILVKNKTRQVVLQNEIGELIMPKEKVVPKNSVDISEVTIPIPPGYWRLGLPHPKTKCLLMRFGRITDQLPIRTEKCFKYFKKLTTPAHRSMLTESKRKDFSLFQRNSELNQNNNPWGSLAQNWDRDAKFREKEPISYYEDNQDVPNVEIKNPKLLARLGTKRKIESEESQTEEQNEALIGKEKVQKQKVKLPRMKMYADEEEEIRTRRKILTTIKKQAEKLDHTSDERDLRNMLGPTNKLVTKKDYQESTAAFDLGAKLKNRNQRMLFAVERDMYGPQLYENYLRRNILERAPIERQEERVREKSPLMSKSALSSMREESLRHRLSRRKTPVRTLHSDRMHQSHRRRPRSQTPEKHSDRTKSKVAVVVRKPTKPTVASTVWSKVRKSSESEQSSSGSDSESDSEKSSSTSSTSESGSDSEESDNSSHSYKKRRAARNPDRPGFDKSRLSSKLNNKSPLKITTTNELYKGRSRKF